MTSIRGNLARLVMRNRHLLRGRRRETFGPDTRVDTLRRQIEESARLARLPKGVSFIPTESAPVYAEWVMPENCAPDCAVLYVHGGGFATGSAMSHRGIVGNFMKRIRCRALTFDYRLAPEHPAPAAVEDAVAGVIAPANRNDARATAMMLRCRVRILLCACMRSPLFCHLPCVRAWLVCSLL